MSFNMRWYCLSIFLFAFLLFYSSFLSAYVFEYIISFIVYQKINASSIEIYFSLIYTILICFLRRVNK